MFEKIFAGGNGVTCRLPAKEPFPMGGNSIGKGPEARECQEDHGTGIGRAEQLEGLRLVPETCLRSG